MAKTTKSKSARRKRKQRRPNIPNYTGPSDAPVAASQAKAKAKTRVKAAPVMTKSTEVDFAKEYHYVINDLRMMVIVSTLMIILLLVLNFLAI